MPLFTGNGRLRDVIIEDVFIQDVQTLQMILSDVILVYADPGFLEVIQKVEGVELATPGIIPSTYTACIDRRYDREFVKKEVEAAILCAEPTRINVEAGLKTIK